ncbi:hypothetical protein GOP47_0026818 [Adiantum capillus-veneris]|nr:hypothetical protein GOP47_0026818 [Adiantum capillus-veneris]
MKPVLSMQRSKDSTSSDKSKAPVLRRENLLKILQLNFGHAGFRGRQLEAIEAVLSGKDCFCLMPTGGGKSLCYQIPALVKMGIVLVVSPLIALMENQVTTLKLQGIAADFLSSTQNATSKSKIFEDLESGKPSLRLLYVTPELIATSSFALKLKKLYDRGLLNLIAIDEAHCISSWGHDFRPSYRQLSKLRTSFSDVPILALTATAAKRVQQDIITSLSLHQPTILISSFNRPNIYYEVRYKDLLKNPYEDLRKLIKADVDACAIVYCHARTTCDEVGAQLQADGISCRVYHAGLGDKVRSAALDDWASGRVPVIVGTVAFGLGIDRKDVRLVCHYNIPKSIESFYQESGRAGRDNKSSRSVLYYGLDDRRSMEYILQNASKRNKKLKDADNLLKKGINDFKEIAAYCDSAGCRRQKLLSRFGEQVTTALCAKTCDFCCHPSQVSDNLQQLSEIKSTGGPGKYHVYISSNDGGARGFESEFWNFSDEDEAEEDISSSDDEATEMAGAVVRKQRQMNKQLESKLDCLLEAEREYDKRQGTKSETSKDNEKKLVTQAIREVAMQKLTKSLEQALERNQTSSFNNVKMMVEKLETDCFKKYGKSGRSFYNSQVASTLRWLSSCSRQDLRAHIPQEAFPTSKQEINNTTGSSMPLDPQLQSQEKALQIRGQKEKFASEAVKGLSVSAQSISSKANVLTITKVDHKRSIDKETKEVSSSTSDARLPSIPSFADFMNKRHKQT